MWKTGSPILHKAEILPIQPSSLWHYELDICTYMYTRVCVCVCTHTCVYVYIYICICTSTHMCTHTPTYTHIYIYMWQAASWCAEWRCIVSYCCWILCVIYEINDKNGWGRCVTLWIGYMHIHVYTRMCVHPCIYICPCTYVCTHTHLHTHTYICGKMS